MCGNISSQNHSNFISSPKFLKNISHMKRSLIARSLSLSTVVETPTAVYSWGLGTNGQLGHAKFEATSASFLSTTNDYVQKEPRRLVKSKSLKKFSCGDDYTIALTATGGLMGWGNLKHLGLGNEKVLQPTVITSNTSFREIASGKSHCAAIDDKGQVRYDIITSSYSLPLLNVGTVCETLPCHLTPPLTA